MFSLFPTEHGPTLPLCEVDTLRVIRRSGRSAETRCKEIRDLRAEAGQARLNESRMNRRIGRRLFSPGGGCESEPHFLALRYQDFNALFTKAKRAGGEGVQNRYLGCVTRMTLSPSSLVKHQFGKPLSSITVFTCFWAPVFL